MRDRYRVVGEVSRMAMIVSAALRPISAQHRVIEVRMEFHAIPGCEGIRQGLPSLILAPAPMLRLKAKDRLEQWLAPRVEDPIQRLKRGALWHSHKHRITTAV